ncbi:NeuD/PglB/VioB family sugar acetyltransferase [Cyanobium sp. BA5m-21]|uniref:NeuD/PglB/VioB family sugar acetyltransferase n=1 Tax=unclassified Cyanobium TaxID=2627006 RepID=UPI0020CC190B|nr:MULTISPECIES: NeuD/PglB/VioB family sugar acetyltransferase [unclassified Cyanobium]MCP9903237.1 NeuD/PglB/VioB family sugar acetyltransferase [Cyanobium sp. BA5m-10]MCP9907923.1 NeuD/PglB/VioB family sugar acetyltransferase [Cyanobium sp. BA5m-21]
MVIGGSGHAHALLAVLQRHGGYELVGLIDSFQPAGSQAHGLPILGGEADVPQLCELHGLHHLLVAIGDNHQRQAMTQRLQQQLPGAVFPALVDPTAVVAADAALAPGVVVMAQAHVGSGCVLDAGALLNTKASLDHDGHLGAFASLAPGAITGGRVHIGTGSFIGLGARLIQGVQVGPSTVVGAGSLVLSDLPSAVLAYGTPARVIRSRHPDEPYL